MIFNKHDIMTTDYVGYGIFNNDIIFKQKQNTEKLNFLFIGGMNAFSRKHLLSICEGFVKA